LKLGISIVPRHPPSEFVEHIRLAERQRFDYAWIADVGLHRETFIMCALASQATSRIRIGPGVVNPYTRHPGIIAAQVATLQEISRGRSFLGLAVGGYRALQQLGIPAWNRPAGTLREAVEILRRLLDGERLNFHGSKFRVVGAQINSQNLPRVPIYLGVMLGRQGLRMAGQLCDGALIVGPLGGQTKRIVDIIRKAANDEGRDLTKLEIAMTAPFAVSYNRSEAIKSVKESVAEFALLDERLRQAVMAEGITHDQISKVRDAVQQRGAIQEAVTDTMVDRFAIAGTPSDCSEKIELLKDIGVTQVVVGTPAADSPDMVRLIGKDIIPNVVEQHTQ
jgi:5,10-methylenetetrahydromethanopterin reductase